MIWQRMIDRLTGQKTRRNERSATRRGKNSRRLKLESLQKRELLASDLGAISGVAFIDNDGDSTYDVGETLLQNVDVNLYLDDVTQNGVFDAGETLVGTMTTGADGAYRFTGLDGEDTVANDDATEDAGLTNPFVTTDGFYVLTFAAGGGGVQDSGGTPIAGVVLSDDVGVQVTDDDGVTAVTIDDFLTAQPSQPITESTVGATATSSSGALGSAGGVVGDERDVEIFIDNASSGSSTFEVVTGSNQLVFSNGGDVEATLLVQYDGVDSDGAGLALDGTGLGGIDLTDGDSESGLQIAVRSDTVVTGGLIVRVYTDAANFSTATIDLPDNIASGDPLDVFVPFSDFVVGAGTGADFTDVGAIEGFVDGVNSNGGAGAPGLDFFLSILDSRKSNENEANSVATVPLTLGGEVFIDNGGGTDQAEQDNGLQDAGEGLFQAPAIDPIEIELYDTDPSDGLQTPIATTTVNPLGGADIGSYSFTTLTSGDDLGPGTYYVMIPADQFTTGQPLEGHIGSSIDTPAGDTDDDAGNDNDGVWVEGVGFISGSITLTIGGEPTGGNENTTVDFGVLPTTDLRIDKTIDNGSSNLTLGGTAVFTVTIINLGETDATDVTVSDTIPEGLTFVSVVDSGATPVATTTTTNGDGRPVHTFTVGNLAAGASVTYTVNTSIDASLTADPVNEIEVSGFQVEVDNDPTDADRAAGDPVDGALENNIAVETADVPLAELTITKTDGIDAPDTVVAGEELTYTVTVTNISTDTATNVVALDTLPTGVSYVAGSGTFTTGSGTVELVSGGADDGKLRITFGDMAGSESETVTFRVLVDAAFQDADSPLSNSVTATADNAADVTATDDTPVEREVDVTVAKTVISTRTPDDRTDGDDTDDIIDSTAPFNVFAGGFVTYQIVATNSGTSEARGVTVTDTLDAGLSLVTGSFDPQTSGATIASASGQTITFNVPDLAPGESRTFTFEAAVASDQFNPLDNDVVIATTDTEPTGHASNTDTVQIDPEARVDLILDKSVNVTTVVPGQDQVIYTFTVSHDDDSISDAVNVDVTDTLPANLTGVSVVAAGASNTNFFNTTTRQILVEYASIPVGETRTFTVTADVDASATGDIVNTASVAVPGVTELDVTNNDDSVTITTTPEFDITISKSTDGTGTVGPLDTVTFTMVVSHDTDDDGTEADNGLSPSLATGIIVTDSLPDGLTFQSATSGGATVTPTSTTNGTIVMPEFDLAPGATRTITITATVDDDASGALTNNVSLVTDTGETQTNNNAASSNVTVVPEADVYVTKTVSASTAQVGTQLTYTVTVFNDGPSPAEGVSVVDTLPSGVTFVSGTGPNGALTATNGVVTVTPLNNAALASGDSFQFTIIATVN
ncbi:MAG: beta strand repeat-containing protein, partial [Rhodopirellula sp. JB053]